MRIALPATHLALLIGSILSLGCAGGQLDAASPTPSAAPPTQPSQPTASSSSSAQTEPQPNAWVSAPADAFRSPTSSRTLFSSGSIVIGEPAPPPEPTRPTRRPHININFRDADLENAARFLADAGRFNVVIESGLTASVSATLNDVDPYDALVAIAEANGAEVQYKQHIVTVRRAQSKK